jgi:hypothetical protein
MAREGLYARTKIEKLQAQVSELQDKLDSAVSKFKDLYEKTKDYTIALRFAPDHIKSLIDVVIAKNKVKADLMRYSAMPPLFGTSRQQYHKRERRFER